MDVEWDRQRIATRLLGNELGDLSIYTMWAKHNEILSFKAHNSPGSHLPFQSIRILAGKSVWSFTVRLLKVVTHADEEILIRIHFFSTPLPPLTAPRFIISHLKHIRVCSLTKVM